MSSNKINKITPENNTLKLTNNIQEKLMDFVNSPLYNIIIEDMSIQIAQKVLSLINNQDNVQLSIENNKILSNLNQSDNDLRLEEIPLDLDKDFTNRHPVQIKIENDLINIDSHKMSTLVKKVCEYLLKRDEQVFSKIMFNEAVSTGRGGKSFLSYDKKNDKFYKIDGFNVYVNTNNNNNTSIALIKKLFGEYGINEEDCSVFCEVPLCEVPLDEDDFENISEYKSIGQYAKQYFIGYFKKHTAKKEIENFTDKEWCRNTFGISYPILKRINIDENIAEQTKDKKGRNRYYVKPIILIGGNNYLITKEWTKNCESQLKNWIISNNKTNLIDTNKENKNSESTIQLTSKVAVDKRVISVLMSHIYAEYRENDNEINVMELNKNEKLLNYIKQSTEYKENPKEIIQKLKDYLQNNNIIELAEDYQRNRYIISDIDKFKEIENAGFSNVGKVEQKVEQIVNKDFDKIDIVELFLINKQQKRCPKCNNKLVPSSISYNDFDEVSNNIPVSKKVYTKICENCHQKFITKGTFKNISWKNTNLKVNNL